MEQVSLNLARKWRSGNFKTIIGQDLVVKILQNSLFKNQFFPVYLFSGQRGCGKTSTARVFAAALNCHELSAFQKNPSTTFPCLTCQSCSAMMQGRHPDFIEIDGASYTGVDNVRSIIDTSSFMPILGQKKIYLIDEVHMLSKAAFNALLKILEEPVATVVFILATTEIHKIPDTIKSRCFQPFFNGIAVETIVQHLQNICRTESIQVDQSGLMAIAQVCEGSLRDAINLLEQTRFGAQVVTQDAVFAVLGYPSDTTLFKLINAVLLKDQNQILQLFAGWGLKHISIEYVVKRMLEMVYDMLMIKYCSDQKYKTLHQDMIDAAVQYSLQDLIFLFDQICFIDSFIAKTSKKQLMFESLMLKVSLASQLAEHKVSRSSVHASLHEEKKKS